MTSLRVRTVLATAGSAVLALTLLVPSAHAADPASGTPANHLAACPMDSPKITSSCLSGAISDYNAARAKEGLGPLRLPTNFTSISSAKQLFVLANIDRADRGLPPIAGLSSTLDSYAAEAANSYHDPAFPSWATEGGSNWASTRNSLWSEYLWVYDDGPGSANADCTSAGQPGCWAHRHTILGNFGGPIKMGAATGTRGQAELVLGRDTHDSANVMTWSSEFGYFSSRSRPTTSITRTSSQYVRLSVTGQSRSTVWLEQYVSGSWKVVKVLATPGTPSTWKNWSATVWAPRGSVRLHVIGNSRYLGTATAAVRI